MEIAVDRFISDNNATISRVNIDGQFECFGFGKWRQPKLLVTGTTRVCVSLPNRWTICGRLRTIAGLVRHHNANVGTVL